MLPKFRLTGHNAPLRAREEEVTESHPGHNINIIDVVNYYIDNGVPRYITELISLCALVVCKNICDSRTFKINPPTYCRSKLVLGMPIYGRGFVLADEDNNGLYCAITGGTPEGPYSEEEGLVFIRENRMIL